MTQDCAAPRLIIQSRNRRGLGHLMRGLNIAIALKTLAPAARIAFYTRNAAAQALCDGFECMVAPDSADEAHWHASAAAYAPDLAVYDTMLPASTRGGNAVFMMRACKPVEQHAVLRSPVLRDMRAIIVPHTRDEFGFDLPADLEARATFVGPIIRPLLPGIQSALRARYGIGAQDRLVVSTVGGGGFAEQARMFFGVIAHAHPLLVERVPHLKHIVVRGPLFTDALASQPGMTVVDFEPELGNLMALADLVIAEGGYNTVNEIRLARTPAVFLPGDRKLDDQHLRVLMMTQAGLAAAFTPALPQAAALAIAKLCASADQLAAMRAAYSRDVIATGNLAAARILLTNARAQPAGSEAQT